MALLAREDRFPAVPGKLSDLLWGPLFARGYDRFNKIAEDAGLRDKRRALLARAQGRTLEIGAGTGVNVELYPDSVTELVLTEPDRLPKAPPIVRPLIVGEARLASHA